MDDYFKEGGRKKYDHHAHPTSLLGYRGSIIKLTDYAPASDIHKKPSSKRIQGMTIQDLISPHEKRMKRESNKLAIRSEMENLQKMI